MLNTKKLLTKILQWQNARFLGADYSNRVNLGTATSVKPSRDGWLVVIGYSSSANTVAPIVRIRDTNAIIGEGVGLIQANTACTATAPVKAGRTYTVEIFRSTVQSVYLY